MLSLQARGLNLLLRTTLKRRMQALPGQDPTEVVRASRVQIAAYAARLPDPPRGFRVDSVDAGGVPAEWVRPPHAIAAAAVLYVHGGGFALGSPAAFGDFSWRLARAGGVAVLMLDYRLAPEHRFPAAVEDARAAWTWLLGQGFTPQRVVLAGDSAGGGLALSAMLDWRDRGLPVPAAAVCLSPWTDLTLSGETLRTNARRDPFLAPEALPYVVANYLGDADPRDPLASPLFGDLEGLPPLLIHAGDTEILLDDSRRFAERARAAGVDVTLEIWPGLPHVFHMFARVLPEANRAFARIGHFIDTHLAGATRE